VEIIISKPGISEYEKTCVRIFTNLFAPTGATETSVSMILIWILFSCSRNWYEKFVGGESFSKWLPHNNISAYAPAGGLNSDD